MRNIEMPAASLGGYVPPKSPLAQAIEAKQAQRHEDRTNQYRELILRIAATRAEPSSEDVDQLATLADALKLSPAEIEGDIADVRALADAKKEEQAANEVDVEALRERVPTANEALRAVVCEWFTAVIKSAPNIPSLLSLLADVERQAQWIKPAMFPMPPRPHVELPNCRPAMDTLEGAEFALRHAVESPHRCLAQIAQIKRGNPRMFPLA